VAIALIAGDFHFLGDVLGGGFLGVSVALLILAAFGFEEKEVSKASQNWDFRCDCITDEPCGPSWHDVFVFGRDCEREQRRSLACALKPAVAGPRRLGRGGAGEVPH
jgi:hypothetical protein